MEREDVVITDARSGIPRSGRKGWRICYVTGLHEDNSWKLLFDSFSLLPNMYSYVLECRPSFQIWFVALAVPMVSWFYWPPFVWQGRVDENWIPHFWKGPIVNKLFLDWYKCQLFGLLSLSLIINNTIKLLNNCGTLTSSGWTSFLLRAVVLVFVFSSSLYIKELSFMSALHLPGLYFRFLRCLWFNI